MIFLISRDVCVCTLCVYRRRRTGYRFRYLHALLPEAAPRPTATHCTLSRCWSYVSLPHESSKWYNISLSCRFPVSPHISEPSASLFVSQVSRSCVQSREGSATRGASVLRAYSNHETVGRTGASYAVTERPDQEYQERSAIAFCRCQDKTQLRRLFDHFLTWWPDRGEQARRHGWISELLHGCDSMRIYYPQGKL